VPTQGASRRRSAAEAELTQNRQASGAPTFLPVRDLKAFVAAHFVAAGTYRHATTRVPRPLGTRASRRKWY
jgi:hypothetical protein